MSCVDVLSGQESMSSDPVGHKKGKVLIRVVMMYQTLKLIDTERKRARY